ncbi:MAG: 30S ribosomal protein S6 [Actinomycetota bacterium]|nr:30S ribosomal protein S6 [Actinomycetota bacterium]
MLAWFDHPCSDTGPRDQRRWRELRKYEILVLVDPEADEETVGRAVDRVTQVLTDNAAQVGTVDRWGRRKLAYEIDKKTEGQYFVVAFQAEPPTLTELDRVLSLADEVMRFKIVRTEAA